MIVPLVALSLAAAAPAPCSLSAEDRAANARLSFEDFDQAGSTPSTARALARRGCYAEAAQATRDYLARGPVETARQQNILTFHLGQYLASSGNEAAAAWVIAATRRPEQAADAPFDWNTYVVGTWAFLVGDRPLLDSASASLSARSGEGDRINARVLRGLQACFGRPYAEAYSDACQAPHAH